jgi:hypothetical protein
MSILNLLDTDHISSKDVKFYVFTIVLTIKNLISEKVYKIDFYHLGCLNF